MTTTERAVEVLSRAAWLSNAAEAIPKAERFERRGLWGNAEYYWECIAGYFVNAGDHYQAAWAEGRRQYAASQIRPQSPPNVAAICD